MDKTIFIEEIGCSDLVKACAADHELYLTFYSEDGFKEYVLYPYQVAPLFELMKEFLNQASMSGGFDELIETVE